MDVDQSHVKPPSSSIYYFQVTECLLKSTLTPQKNTKTMKVFDFAQDFIEGACKNEILGVFGEGN